MNQQGKSATNSASAKKKNQPKRAARKVIKSVNVEGLQRELAEVTADLQRIQADFVNYKRRTEEEKSALVNFGRRDALINLLPILDNVNRALAHTPPELANNDWTKGVQSVAKQLMGELEKLGVQKIETIGYEFDPHLHEAVAVEGDGIREIITEELQAGYLLNGEVVRHAMVKISRQ